MAHVARKLNPSFPEQPGFGEDKDKTSVTRVLQRSVFPFHDSYHRPPILIQEFDIVGGI